MTQPKMDPHQTARLETMKRQWEQKRRVSQRLSKIKCKIGVYSGKGGVGKTTVAANMAVVMAQRGASVGLLDADVDCPNVLGVLGVMDGGRMEQGVLIPPEKYGVKVVSMSFFQKNEEEAIIWRGPMIHQAINDFIERAEWGDLDYLIVDLPPGTSDAPLTVMQMIQPDGFVVVTTPQVLAKLDAKRSINMITRLNTRVLGVVENMSGQVFGQGAGEDLSMEMGIPFLGRLMLRPEYRSTVPPVVENSEIRQEYDHIVDGAVSQLEQNMATATPSKGQIAE
jgi:ATP-binding protein involved in chromosome partitioning